MPRRYLLWSLTLVVCLGIGVTPLVADHRDGPIFENTATSGRADIGDLYLFRSPSNASNTVFVMTVSPGAGAATPATFDQAMYYDFKIDSTGDLAEDITLRVSFGAPDGSGAQDVLLRGLPASKFPPNGILAKGKTGQNLPIAGGGTFRAAVQDDPFFFDEQGWNLLVDDGLGTFPRPVGTATDCYGPNANILAIVIEIASARIRGSVVSNPNGILAVWARDELLGVQQDREAIPLNNLGLIPPEPRNDLSRGERRNAYNAGLPKNDRADFGADMLYVLQHAPWTRNSTDASFLRDALLPDASFFQVGNPGGFGTLVGPGPFSGGPFAGGQLLGNGRRLSDDVMDILLNLLTNGGRPSDNVGDDNGLNQTDGSFDPVSTTVRTIAFPYIGAPHLPLASFPPCTFP